jgi:hypothetical protein
MMENILFVAPNMFVLRNWIASGLTDHCEELLKLKPIILSHFSDKFYNSPKGKRIPNYFFPKSNKRKELPYGFSKLLFIIYYLRLRTFAIEFTNGSYQMMLLAKKKDAINLLCRSISFVFPKRSHIRSFLRNLIDSINPRNPCATYLQMIKPSCVVVGSPGFLFLDQAVIIEAKRLKISVHCVVSSWDNMTSRGPMIRRPDTLMVWNQYMAEHASTIHNFDLRKVHVVGSLQFSQYSRQNEFHERKDMFKRINLPLESPYFLYLTGQHVPYYEAEDIKMLLNTLEGSKFSDIPLVVRIHPQANKGPFSKLSHPKLIFDHSPEFSDNGSNGLSFGIREIILMACLLQSSSIVFSSWGTTALLEAAIFDKPIIQLRWMGAFSRNNADEARKVVEFQKYLHLIPFDKTGCRLFCDAPERLYEDIKTLFNTNDIFKARRKNAIRELAMLPLEDTPQRIIKILENEIRHQG